MKEQFVAKRIVNIGLIFLVAIGFSVIAGRMSGMYLDQLLGIGALTVLFMVLFAFLLIYERNRKRISHNRETDRFSGAPEYPKSIDEESRVFCR